MSIYKRGQVWWMNFQFNGKRIQESTKCKNKRDAETVERAYRTQLAKGEVGIIDKPDAPNFEMAMKDYLAWAEVEHAKKPNTLRSYKSTSSALCAFFAQTKIDEIGSGDVEKFKQWRSKQKCQPRSEVKSTKKSNKKKPKTKLSTLKPATINRELALLKIVFNYFIKKDILIKNAVSSVKFFSEDNQQTRVVSNEEEKVYLMAASQPLQDFATVMIDTGMRPEEVSHIERKNIFLDEGYLFIPFGKTKAAKRKIPLTSRVREILEKRLDNIEGNHLFITESTGKPLTTLKTAHGSAIRRSKVEAFRLYDLRHTFATRFVESGGDIVTLQALLGHSNIQMITRYAHPTEKHQFEAMKVMEAARLRKAA